MAGKLFIYDNTDETNQDQAAGRFGSGVTVLSVGSKKELLAKLDELVKQAEFFDRVVIQTHGWDGTISIGGDVIGRHTIRDFLKYNVLFPGYTRIYFDGCEAAKGDTGTEFMRATGQTLLINGGGQTIGWVGSGIGVPGWIPLIGGHTVHDPTGEIKVFTFLPGGIVKELINPESSRSYPRVYLRH